jgi:hypothetical protein
VRQTFLETGGRPQAFDLQKLVEQERHAFPEDSDRYRHISQDKVRFDFAGGRHHIFLYLDGDLKGRICTSDNNLFHFLFRCASKTEAGRFCTTTTPASS